MSSSIRLFFRNLNLHSSPRSLEENLETTQLLENLNQLRSRFKVNFSKIPFHIAKNSSLQKKIIDLLTHSDLTTEDETLISQTLPLLLKYKCDLDNSRNSSNNSFLIKITSQNRFLFIQNLFELIGQMRQDGISYTYPINLNATNKYEHSAFYYVGKQELFKLISKK